MRQMQRWILRGGWVAVSSIAWSSIACSAGLGNAPNRAEPLPVYGAPEDDGSGPVLRSDPLIEVTTPAIPSRCRARGRLALHRIGQSVLPTWGQRGRPRVVAPLPSGNEPPELAVSVGDRRVIEVAGGVLVAIDQGEFGAGLYHLRDGAAQAEALDAHLSHRIHWIGQTRDRIFGVSGLCHGVACDMHQRSVVFDVRLEPIGSGDDMRQAWHIDPIAVLPGCPDAIGLDGAERALLIATCHGLFRIDELGATTLATWPTWLGATDIAEVRGVDAPIFFVSFGTLIGRFSAGQSNWYSAPECVQR
jgi:hypothetical protein